MNIEKYDTFEEARRAARRSFIKRVGVFIKRKDADKPQFIAGYLKDTEKPASLANIRVALATELDIRYDKEQLYIFKCHGSLDNAQRSIVEYIKENCENNDSESAIFAAAFFSELYENISQEWNLLPEEKRNADLAIIYYEGDITFVKDNQMQYTLPNGDEIFTAVY